MKRGETRDDPFERPSEASRRDRSRGLQERLSRLQLLVETVPHGIQENDTRGVITYSNRAHHAMHGYEVPELIGKPIFEMVPAGPQREMLQEHFAQILRDEPQPTPWFGRDLTRDGSEIDVRVDWDYRRDDAGKVVGFASVITDITEQARAEAALEEERAHVESLIEAARGFVLYRLRTSPNSEYQGEVVLVSPSIREILGVTEPMNFATWFEGLHPEDRARVEEANRHSASSGELFDQIMRIRHPGGGGIRWVRAISAPVLDEDGLPRFFNGLIVDVTNQMRAEKEKALLESRMLQTQKLESLGVLAGGISHDFNNLLMGILGNADLALQELPPEIPGRRNVEDISTIARRAADLTNQILAYSGKGTFIVERVAVNRVLEEIVHLLRTVLPKDAELRLDLHRPSPWIEADVSQVRQIVMNLLSNAGDALGGEPGTVMVRSGLFHLGDERLKSVWLPDTPAEGDYVFIEVADSGCGMDGETRQRVFDPFFSTKSGGRGLGMAAALGIVRGHSGAIRVISEPGEGTRVTVLLPPAERGEVEDESDATPVEADDSPEARVLVAEDEEPVRRVVKRMLESGGFDVVVVRDGLEALEVLREQAESIDVALLDLTMPRMGGEEAFERIRESWPGLPVILSSGYSEQEVVVIKSVERLAGFIQKPYRTAELLAVIRAACKPPMGE